MRRRHRVGRVRRGLRGLGPRSDVHAHHGPRLLAGGEERVPRPAVEARQPEIGGELAEGDGPHAPVGVAPDLGRGQVGIPQRDEAQRDEPAAALAAPLLHHPVVVGLDAQPGQLAVLAPEELLAAEARIVREAELRLHPVDVHVLQALLDPVTARPHLVVAHTAQLDLLAREPRCGDRALERRAVVLVAPPRHLGPLGPGLLHVAAPHQLRHPARQQLDVRADLAVARGQPGRPHVGRLDDVRVEVDDGRDPVRRRRVVRLLCLTRLHRMHLRSGLPRWGATSYMIYKPVLEDRSGRRAAAAVPGTRERQRSRPASGRRPRIV